MKPHESLSLPTTLSAWEQAEREGFDMSLIEHSLTLSVWERIRAHSRALAMALALREAMEKRDGRSGL
jgi:hypothetical protein